MQYNQQKKLIFGAQTIQQIKNSWDSFTPAYSTFDATPQTFYYSLVNILQINHANNILEIACGTGRLLPYSINLKSIEAHYLASDISSEMVSLCKKNLQKYLIKSGVQLSVQSWMNKHHLQIAVVNGQEPIETSKKFDRIICNLVLMITKNPLKMMRNLYDYAETGCLMGVTIWGNPEKNNFLTLSDKGKKALGIEPSSARSFFHLYGKIDQIAAESGWEVLITWQQNAPFNFIESDEKLKAMVSYTSGGNPQLAEWCFKEASYLIASKQILNFSVQMAVLRKK